MDGPQDKHATDELLRFCDLYREILKGYAEKVIKGKRSSGMKRLKQPLIKNKTRADLRGASTAHAYREGHVCSRHRCLSSC